MISLNQKAVVTCIDLKQLKSTFSGREYDTKFLEDLPKTTDPCGENGEFHSFVYDGPIFNKPLHIKLGPTKQREGFVFTDILEIPQH